MDQKWILSGRVGIVRVEDSNPHLAALDPKSSVSTNFTHRIPKIGVQIYDELLLNANKKDSYASIFFFEPFKRLSRLHA